MKSPVFEKSQLIFFLLEFKKLTFTKKFRTTLLILHSQQNDTFDFRNVIILK